MFSTYSDIVLRGKNFDCGDRVGGNTDDLDPGVLELNFLYMYHTHPSVGVLTGWQMPRHDVPVSASRKLQTSLVQP